MKELHVGESVRVGTPSEEVRGTVVDLDRRPGYGRLIIDCDELSNNPLCWKQFAVPDDNVLTMSATVYRCRQKVGHAGPCSHAAAQAA